jgi:selenophosphate synthetase-related protein
MVASAVFVTDLQGKAIISRNYRGDVPLTKSIERFAKYLVEVEEEAKKPIFHVDSNGDVETGDEVGASGAGGETFVYVSVSTESTEMGVDWNPFSLFNAPSWIKLGCKKTHSHLINPRCYYFPLYF